MFKSIGEELEYSKHQMTTSATRCTNHLAAMLTVLSELSTIPLPKREEITGKLQRITKSMTDFDVDIFALADDVRRVQELSTLRLSEIKESIIND